MDLRGTGHLLDDATAQSAVIDALSHRIGFGRGIGAHRAPPREAVNDVLVTRQPVHVDDLPEGFVIATSSPRRIAQIKRLGAVTVVPIRGNVPPRIAKLEREDLDGVVLAAAGLRRLSLTPPHTIDLPVDRFVPAPAQGALAIQTRRRETAEEIVAALEHPPTRITVDAERSFLWKIGAGCHVPVAAHATIEGETIHLRAQLFSDDGSRCAEGTHQGTVAVDVGCELAVRLMGELEPMA